jgi:hypothetical protein
MCFAPHACRVNERPWLPSVPWSPSPPPPPPFMDPPPHPTLRCTQGGMALVFTFLLEPGRRVAPCLASPLWSPTPPPPPTLQASRVATLLKGLHKPVASTHLTPLVVPPCAVSSVVSALLPHRGRRRWLVRLCGPRPTVPCTRRPRGVYRRGGRRQPSWCVGVTCPHTTAVPLLAEGIPPPELLLAVANKWCPCTFCLSVRLYPVGSGGGVYLAIAPQFGFVSMADVALTDALIWSNIARGDLLHPWPYCTLFSLGVLTREGSLPVSGCAPPTLPTLCEVSPTVPPALRFAGCFCRQRGIRGRCSACCRRRGLTECVGCGCGAFGRHSRRQCRGRCAFDVGL